MDETMISDVQVEPDVQNEDDTARLSELPKITKETNFVPTPKTIEIPKGYGRILRYPRFP